jgi:hypothetical protein
MFAGFREEIDTEEPVSLYTYVGVPKLDTTNRRHLPEYNLKCRNYGTPLLLINSEQGIPSTMENFPLV